MSDQFHVDVTGVQKCTNCDHKHQINEMQYFFKYCKNCGYPLREDPTLEVNIAVPVTRLTLKL